MSTFTNEAIFRALDLLSLTEESLNQVEIGEEKKRYIVIQIPTEMVSYLLNSRDDLNLRFELYIKEGKHGKIKKADWLNRRKKRPRTPVKN